MELESHFTVIQSSLSGRIKECDLNDLKLANIWVLKILIDFFFYCRFFNKFHCSDSLSVVVPTAFLLEASSTRLATVIDYSRYSSYLEKQAIILQVKFQVKLMFTKFKLFLGMFYFLFPLFNSGLLIFFDTIYVFIFSKHLKSTSFFLVFVFLLLFFSVTYWLIVFIYVIAKRNVVGK